MAWKGGRSVRGVGETGQAEQARGETRARRLGIVSNRDDDAEGIQIFVPAFQGGDTHTILFDLVVDAPGPVLDVRAQFKDLLRLGNGEASERLVLPRGRNTTGPMERAVTLDRLVQDLADTMMQASRSPDAARLVENARHRLIRAQADAALRHDETLQAQVALCDRVLARLSGGHPSPPLQQALRLASHRLVFGASSEFGTP